MKKWLSVILVCIMLVASFSCVGATGEDNGVKAGFIIEINGSATDCTSVVYNDTHYIPMRRFFENMGGAVFYRSRDNQILALTRDGGVIRHIIGDDKVIVNGDEKLLSVSSIIENNETYIPVEMLTYVFVPEEISYDNQRLNMRKPILNSNIHQAVKDVLDARNTGGFYAERFQKYVSYHLRKPSYSIDKVVFNVNLGLDYSFYESICTIENPYEISVLVNKYNKLPADFEQQNLVSVGKAYASSSGYLLLDKAYEKYVQMSDAAKKEGLSMMIVSAYRTEAQQRSLYNQKVRATGKVNADNYSARPGHSEHQTGLAVDIGSTKGTFQYTPEFRWLQKHAHEYGFILRYPEGKEWITGYSYEPWHYRYVGVDAAKIIYEEGITYEEYYAKYISVNEFR